MVFCLGIDRLVGGESEYRHASKVEGVDSSEKDVAGVLRELATKPCLTFFLVKTAES